MMKDLIASQFAALVAEGDVLVRRLPRGESGHGLEYYADSDRVPEYQAWFSRSANLLRTVAPAGSHYPEQFQALLTHENMKHGIVSVAVQQAHGVLIAAQKDWSDGLLRRIEYLLAAATFDDFLSHAEVYHKGGKKTESAVLASAVLEDAIKKIAAKNGLDPDGQSLEQLIDELVRIQVLNSVKGKKVKSWAGVRNHALHAEWDKFDIKDAGMLIAGVRELLETYL